MLIDFHTHCFPQKIANAAIEKLSFSSGGFEPHTNGTVSGLLEQMKKSGVDVSVVMSIATNAKQQEKVNNFAAEINKLEGIVAFGSVYPKSEDAFSELERIRDLGLKGVKLHPDYQGFQVDDPDLRPLYKKISSLGLITLFHSGYDYGFAPPYGATPEKMATAIKWFDSPVIAAHWGGLNCSEGVLKYLCKTDVYLDTAFGYSHIPKYFVKEILDSHGADKILFGTDCPWHTADMEMRLIDTLDISKEDLEKIRYKNAKKLLKL